MYAACTRRAVKTTKRATFSADAHLRSVNIVNLSDSLSKPCK